MLQMLCIHCKIRKEGQPEGCVEQNPQEFSSKPGKDEGKHMQKHDSNSPWCVQRMNHLLTSEHQA